MVKIFFKDTHPNTFIWVLTSFGWAGFDNRVGNALLSPCDQCCLLGRGWLDLDVIGWGIGTGAGSQGGGTADRAQYGDTVRGLDRKCCHLGQVSSPWGIGGSLKGKVSPMKEKGKQAHRPYHLTSLDKCYTSKEELCPFIKDRWCISYSATTRWNFSPILRTIIPPFPPPPTKKFFTEDNHSQNQKQNVEVKWKSIDISI